MNSSSKTLAQIKELDGADRLAAKRGEFLLPEDTIYLNGNSLGPLTLKAQQRSQEVVQQQWQNDLIASWNTHDWIDLPFAAAEKIAPLIGATANEVVCCDSVSVNLVKLLACCLQLQGARNIVLTQRDDFPTDLYAVQGLESLLGAKRCKLLSVGENEIEDALTEDIAVLLLTQVNFRSGNRHDIEYLTKLAKERGILVIWDLSHSVGVIPIELDAWSVDFAVGCGYKYLNGGPGAPAFVYANQKHHAAITQPLQGWMGHREPFQFDPEYAKGAGMAQFLVGTPPILSLSTLDAAIDVFTDIRIQEVYKKAKALGELFVELIRDEEDLQVLRLESSPDSNLRGAHLAYSNEFAYGICRALNDAGVIVDYRSPDIIRFGFSPLFLSYEDVWRAVDCLRSILQEGSHLKKDYAKKLKVT